MPACIVADHERLVHLRAGPIRASDADQLDEPRTSKTEAFRAVSSPQAKKSRTLRPPIMAGRRARLPGSFPLEVGSPVDQRQLGAGAREGS